MCVVDKKLGNIDLHYLHHNVIHFFIRSVFFNSSVLLVCQSDTMMNIWMLNIPGYKSRDVKAWAGRDFKGSDLLLGSSFLRFFASVGSLSEGRS